VERFKHFERKDFIEQGSILMEVEEGKLHAAIPDLLELCRFADSKDQIQFLAESTLKTLLSENEAETVKGLGFDSANIVRICAQTSGEARFKSAVPVLIDLATHQEDPALLLELLTALSQMKAPETVDVFRKCAAHADPMISVLSIKSLGEVGDAASADLCFAMIDTAQSEDKFEICELTTACAIESLGRIADDKAISFLVSMIHHKNPTARRIIHETIEAIGSDAVPVIAETFKQNDSDHIIMAANLLGRIGDKRAGEVLMDALEKATEDQTNIRFAIYEALGAISSLKSLVCLMDGLLEKEEMVLMAVVSSLDNQMNPGVVERIKALMCADALQAERVIKSVVSSKAVNLFESLYIDGHFADPMVDAVIASGDEDTAAAFHEKLNSMGDPKSMADAGRLMSASTSEETDELKTILAVDDSSAMLSFYRTALSEIGFNVLTAEDGKKAIDIVNAAENIALIVTDMNMPVMDGIEFTQKVRANESMKRVPIVMSTTESEISQVRIAQNAGVNLFMKKPFPADVLQKKIARLVEKGISPGK